MASSDDLDATMDGFDPSELTERVPRRRRQPENALDNLEPKAAQYAAAPKPPRKERMSNADTGKNHGQPRMKTERMADMPADRKQPISPGGVVKILTDDRLRVFLGVGLMLLCIFIIIAFVSHVRTGALDQSRVMNSTLAEMAQVPGEIHNAGGGFGAWLSHTLLCDALGLGSIVLVAYTALLALALLGIKKISFWSLTFKTLLLSITISLVLGLVFYDTPSVLKWGGNHGHYVNKFLIDHSTILGALCVSVLMTAAVVCVYLHELQAAIKRMRESKRLHSLQEQLKKQKKRELETIDTPTASTDTHTDDATQQPAEKEQVGIDIPASDSEIPVITDSVEIPLSGQTSTSEFEKYFDDNDGSDLDQGGFSIGGPMPQPTNAGTQFAPAAEKREPAPDTNVNPFNLGAKPGGTAMRTDANSTEDEAFSIVAPEIEKAEIIADETTARPMEPYDHRADLYNYQFPPVDLLKESKNTVVVNMEEQQANKDKIVETLANYNIAISKIEATVGPTITLYEIVPADGVRISSIKRLEDDIAMSLSALGIRIIAPMPGKGTVGIEVPNNDPQTVSMHSVITSKKFQESTAALPMALGATISNDIFIADMAKMPHLLVAGATGMGKSVGLNAIITSLIYKKHPSELKFVLVDPKMVEFSLYNKLERHYLAKLETDEDEDAVITESAKVIQTLNSLCVEMDNRYALLKNANVRAIEEYNKKFTDRRLNPTEGHRYLPYIVVVVDEFADLIMVAGKEVEAPIMRIAQKARAVGIHMIIATQRPATNVITGNIKANFPGRIAFRVIQMVDSKTILDATGANQLIGRGDMLFSHNGNVQRVQCAFISTEEVEAITDWIDAQVGYSSAYPLPEVPLDTAGEGGPIAGASTEKDSLFDEVARFVVQRQMGSTSSVQRQFGIGYNRAGRLMDQLEAAGIVGPVNGAKPRSILVDIMGLEAILSQ